LIEPGMWIDTHCHTKYSYDNWLEPADLVRRARGLGLDAICVTEHYSYEASAPVEEVARGEGMLLLRGVEVSTDRGHLLVFGVEDDSWNRWGRDTYLPLQALIEHINDLGGVCVPAHPYRRMGVASLLDGIFDLRGISGVETHNGSNSRTDDNLALLAATHLKLPGFGGSDCHKVEAVGRCATEFLQPVTDMASFIAAIRVGACRGAYRPGERFGKDS
jgi:hypothetical protein